MNLNYNPWKIKFSSSSSFLLAEVGRECGLTASVGGLFLTEERVVTKAIDCSLYLIYTHMDPHVIHSPCFCSCVIYKSYFAFTQLLRRCLPVFE